MTLELHSMKPLCYFLSLGRSSHRTPLCTLDNHNSETTNLEDAGVTPAHLLGIWAIIIEWRLVYTFPLGQ
jgi:hypothetical protein